MNQPKIIPGMIPDFVPETDSGPLARLGEPWGTTSLGPLTRVNEDSFGVGMLSGTFSGIMPSNMWR